MANSTAISFTCGCSFAHITNTNTIKYSMCSTHSGAKVANQQVIRDIANQVITKLQEFRGETGN